MTAILQISPRPRGALVLAAAVVTGLGGLAIGVRTTPPTAMASGVRLAEIDIPLARLTDNVLGIAAVGLALFNLLQTRRRSGTALGVCWLLATLSVLWLQAAEISPRGISVTSSETLDYLTHITTGRALMVTCAAAVGYAVLGRLHPAIALLCGLVGIVAVPYSGHASQTDPSALGRLAILLHVTGAATWVGGLGAILLLAATRPDVLATVLPRFSALAGICILTVAASGVVLTIQRLAPGGLLTSLTTTGYGVLILAKAGCLCVLGCTGGYIRQRLLPRIVRHEPAGLTAWAGAELAIMTLAVALATALARAPMT